MSIRFPPFKFCTQNEVIWKQLETLKSNGEYWYIQRLLGQILEINYPSKQDIEEGQKKVIRNPDVNRWTWSEAKEWDKDEDFLPSMGGLQSVSNKKWSLIFSKTLLQQYYKYMEITFFFFKHEPNHHPPGESISQVAAGIKLLDIIAGLEMVTMWVGVMDYPP